MGNTPSGHLGTQGHQLGTHGSVFTPSDGFFLINAARSGDVEVLRLFLTKNPALAWAVSEQDKSTPWHSAAAEGHLHALTILGEVSKQGAMSNTFNPTTKAVNQVDSKGRTPLMLACKSGHYACAQLLLELGGSWSVMDTDGQTALHYAALASHGGCVLLLLKQMGLYGDHGPEPPEDTRLLMFVNAGDVPYGRTPLHLAAWSGQAEGLHALLQAGASIMPKTVADCFESSFPCNTGTTPLHLAAMMGHEHAAILIMAAYVKAVKRHSTMSDPRQSVDAYGNTPFKLASSRHRTMPILLQVLNPNSIIVELQRWQKKQQAQQQQQQPAQKSGSEAGPSTPKKGPSSRAGPAQDSPANQASPTTTPLDPAAPETGPEGSGRSGKAEGVEGGASQAKDRDGSGVDRQGQEDKAGAAPSSDKGGNSTSVTDQDITSEGIKTKPSESPSDGHAPGSPGSSTISGSSASGTTGDDTSDMSGSDEDDTTTTTEPDKSVSSAPATPDHTAPPRISIRRLKRLAAVSAIAHSTLDAQPSTVTPSGSGAPLPPTQSTLAGRGGPGTAGLTPATSGATVKAGASTGTSQGKPPLKLGQLGRSAGSSSDGSKSNAEPPPSHRHKELSEKPVPDFYVCPLTCRIFKDPVVASDGYTYERVAIEKHVQRQQQEKVRLTSPSTRKPLTSAVVYPNNTLVSAVEFWKAQNNYCPEDMT